MSGNDGGYSGYGGVGNGVNNGVNNGTNNGGLDFEAQFRNMVSMTEQDTQQLGVASSRDSTTTKKKVIVNKNNIGLIILVILASIGMIGAVASFVIMLSYYNEVWEEEAFIAELESAGGEQTDSAAYRDVAFSDNNSDAALLVYAAVKNNEEVSVDWFEDFKKASVKYSLEYEDRQRIPEDATFGSVVVLDAVGGLYPNMPLKRFLFDMVEGCARFDLYEDLLLIYDYEFLPKKCIDAGADWDYLVGVGLEEEFL